MKLEMMLKWYD